MNKDIFEGNWEETKGKMKQLWGKLTDNDFKVISCGSLTLTKNSNVVLVKEGSSCHSTISR